MRFTKMHGLGNDFIVVARKEPLCDQDFLLARKVCNRRFGIGADGLVFLLPSSRADFAMRIINADGSYTEQCGNAIRCAAKYFYESISDSQQELVIETEVGLQRASLTVEEGMVSAVCVDMGPPVLQGVSVPKRVEEPIEVDGEQFRVTGVSMGNPHAVIFVEDATRFPVERWGPKLETHPRFPHKTNVEFIRVRSRKDLEMRVWERGVGRTMACGSGACASVVAGVLTGRTGRSVTVHLEGGQLKIEWRETDGHVYMTGPAHTVFVGEWRDDLQRKSHPTAQKR